MAAVIPVYTQNDGIGERYYETVGGYSICPPKSWQATEFPGLKYHIFSGPVFNGFAPNINFVDQQYDSSLSEYVDLNIAQMRQLFNNFILVSRTNFSTNDNMSGERLVVIAEHYSKKIKQIFYFFSKENIKIVITCSVLADGEELYDEIFDESIKTFRW
jgi:hypothetical protein